MMRTPAAQLDRPATILKPGGVMAIVVLNQVDSPDNDGFFGAVQHIYERYHHTIDRLIESARGRVHQVALPNMQAAYVECLAPARLLAQRGSPAKPS